MTKPKRSHLYQMRVPMPAWLWLKELAAERNTTVTAIVLESLGIEPGPCGNPNWRKKPQRREQRERVAEERIEGDAAGRHQTASEGV
jgi:hypothetical protein